MNMKFRIKFFKNIITSLCFFQILTIPLYFSQSLKARDVHHIKSTMTKYGILNIINNSINYQDQKYIVKGYNSMDEEIYIAISCIKKKINVTSKDFAWKNWLPPIYEFESRLINDICSGRLDNKNNI